MRSDRLAGLEATYAIFASLPQGARDELARDLSAIGSEALAAQSAASPERTGKLRAALTVSEEVARLRVRIGLLSIKRGRSGLFYAIIQEYGRRAQDVFVRRLKRGARADWRRQIRAGQASARVKPASLASGYVMHVRAMPGRHFVHQETRIDQIADRVLAGFWEKALARAGGEL